MIKIMKLKKYKEQLKLIESLNKKVEELEEENTARYVEGLKNGNLFSDSNKKELEELRKLNLSKDDTKELAKELATTKAKLEGVLTTLRIIHGDKRNENI